MGEQSKIEWTHHTFNPWWGCVRVSPGCEHCYAEAFSKRTGNAVWGVQSSRRFFGDKHWAEPLLWDAAARKAGVRERVFCASMADVFEEREDLTSHRTRLFDLMCQTTNLDWLLLTKRPENIAKFGSEEAFTRALLGTTVEDNKRLARIDDLILNKAKGYFLSCEPLLEDLGNIRLWLGSIDWVIAGGESGHGARPMNEAWVRSLRDQCAELRVKFFYKQRVEGRNKISLPMLDGRQWAEVPA